MAANVSLAAAFSAMRPAAAFYPANTTVPMMPSWTSRAASWYEDAWLAAAGGLFTAKANLVLAKDAVAAQWA